MMLRKELEAVQRTEEYREMLKRKIEEIEASLLNNLPATEEIEEFNNLTGRDYDRNYFLTYWRSRSKEEFIDEACNPNPTKLDDVTKEEFIELVSRIKDIETYGNLSNYYLEVLEANILMPNISDLIYFRDLSSEEVIEEALKYKPIIL